MRLIDADALLKTADSFVEDAPAWLIKFLIKSAPTVDLARHGRWIYDGVFCGISRHHCSECEKTEFRMSDYCPNCGAKMDEVEE